MTKQTQDTLALLRATRKNTLGIFVKHDLEQQNTIPAGLNNNMVWNAGHVIATMELLVYAMAGLKTPSGREFIDRYRKGTRPQAPVSAEDCHLFASKLSSSIEQLEQDLETLDFNNYKEYTTSYGVTLTSVDDALAFNNMHEAMHLGTMLALRNLV